MSKLLAYSHVLLPYSRSHNNPQVYPKTGLIILSRSAQRKPHVSASTELNIENKMTNLNIYDIIPSTLISWHRELLSIFPYKILMLAFHIIRKYFTFLTSA